jgi:hypothetical protein
MGRSFYFGLGAWFLCTCTLLAQEQTSPGIPSVPDHPAVGSDFAAPPPPVPTALADQVPAAVDSSSLLALQNELAQNAHQLQQFQHLQASAQDAKEVERLQKQVELLQKQIDVLQKMIENLAKQLQNVPDNVDARLRQAARRDQDLANAVDDLRERQDADRRWGPLLPATLKELFLPSEPNETPLSIYGGLWGQYRKFEASPGAGLFEFEEFDLWVLLRLNDWILVETELGFSPGGVEIGQAQIDFLVNDWLTVEAGRLRVPIGYFNMNQHPGWINKLPDFPLMFRQVSPADFSLNGVEVSGGFYLGCSPVKVEYNLYAANGLGFPQLPPAFTDLADLAALQETSTQVNDAMAYGGRIGLRVPEWGVYGGISSFTNTPYHFDTAPKLALWGADAGWHYGDWDVRFECAEMYENGPGLITPIMRRGLYAQVAYRPYEAPCRLLANMEGVFRYGATNFSGIDPADLDPGAFPNPIDVPVDRQQFTFGINYYFYPSCLLKLAYEVNVERKGVDLNDNVFYAQVAWGF